MAFASSTRRNAPSRDESGFTLIELLITIVITAVLAGITVPAIAQAAILQRDDAAQNSVAAIALAESAVFPLQRSYVTLGNLTSRKLADGVVNATVLLGPNNSCYTAIAVSKNGVAYIAENGLAATQLATTVTSSCAKEVDLQGAVISLGGNVAARAAIPSIDAVSSISYLNGSLTWLASTGATAYRVELLSGATWSTVQQTAALTYPVAKPAVGVSVRYRVTAVNGALLSATKDFLLTSDTTGNLVTSGDLANSAFGWTMATGAYYSNMTAGAAGYINLPLNGTATQVVSLPTTAARQLTGVFSSTAGVTVKFDFFPAGANTATDTPISTVVITATAAASGATVTPPTNAALAKVTVTNTSSTSSQLKSLTLQ